MSPGKDESACHSNQAQKEGKGHIASVDEVEDNDPPHCTDLQTAGVE
jgi:hypothetical protein